MGVIIYLAYLVGNKENKKLRVEECTAKFSQDKKQLSFPINNGKNTQFIFTSSIGKPNENFGIGRSKEEAIESFRNGQIKQAEKYERIANSYRNNANIEYVV